MTWVTLITDTDTEGGCNSTLPWLTNKRGPIKERVHNALIYDSAPFVQLKLLPYIHKWTVSDLLDRSVNTPGGSPRQRSAGLRAPIAVTFQSEWRTALTPSRCNSGGHLTVERQQFLRRARVNYTTSWRGYGRSTSTGLHCRLTVAGNGAMAALPSGKAERLTDWASGRDPCLGVN